MNALIHSSRLTSSSNDSTDSCADLSLSEKEQGVGLSTRGLLHQSWVDVLVPSYDPPEQEPLTTETLGGGPEVITMLGTCGSRGNR